MNKGCVILIAIGAFVLGGLTGVFATRSACKKAEAAIDQMTEQIEKIVEAEGEKKK